MVRQSLRNAKPATTTTTTTTTTTAKTAVTAVKVDKTVSAKVAVNGRVKTEKVETKKTTVSKRKAASTDAAAADHGDPDHVCAVKDEDDDDVDEKVKKPAAKKRKTKGDDNMPLAARTAVTSLKRAMFIGAHVSGAGGVQNSIQNAANIGANSFAVFLKSQRKWQSPPLAADTKKEFHALLKQHGYDAAQHILPHGSYLVNLAQADQAKADQAYDNFLDDLKRCEALGIQLYNFHPGSTGGAPMDAAVSRIAAQLNRSHKATKSVITVIENMCGSGNVVGSRFEELRDIISLVDDKSRVGVCIDTCHAFAAGYDLSSPKAFAETMAHFDDIVGIEYLKAFHLNDSKAPFGSHRDLHANIGTGFLGLRAFHNIMNHAPFENLPMVLETPIDEKGPDGKSVENRQIWADEIKLLESLIGMDADTPEFAAKEAELQARGAAERDKIQDQVDKKAEKDAKKGSKAKPKAKAAPKKRTKKEETDDDDDDEDSD
ncbi:xylose isomerase-like protein [Podospora appendiculata]|uniref:Apurinic-apyrimidinic endonuclease 1 n=1 Tax=Podospora appendiculata TaxID=314037 RepID=A0AAE0XL66_9PEZI|nr:xylose isomerase-like protein [Podospora appendiculata]